MAGGVDSRAEEYKHRVLALDHGGLLEMWERLYRGTPLPGWPPGKALEYLILRAFQLEGAEVTWPYHVEAEHPYAPRRKLEQIDGIVCFDGLSCLVECKHHRRPMDITPIVKLKSQISRRPRITMGAVFSTSVFHPAALELSRRLSPADVLLWRGREIDRALRKGWLCEGMKKKLIHAVKTGFADLDLVETRHLP